MRVINYEVYGLDRAIKASGIPMTTGNIKSIYQDEPDLNDVGRAERLANVPNGSGHDCYLKGITVNMLIKMPQYWWLQFGRYHFADIVSSQSKMHQLKNMNLEEHNHLYVTQNTIDELRRLQKEYKENPTKQNFQRLVANTPMGFELTAEIRTNYLQLKNMYSQRRNHKLKEWQYFCDYLEGLPRSELIISNKLKEED